MAKVPFLALFRPDMKTEMGVVIYMYLNIPQIILIPNIYGCMSLIPWLKYHFWLFSLTLGKEGVWLGKTQPMSLPE